MSIPGVKGLALSLLTAVTVGWPAVERISDESSTTIVGVVRTEGTGAPIANSVVYSDHFTLDTARSDSLGRFVMRVSRLTSLFGARKDGFLEFQYPLLDLKADTVFADIELRRDPASRNAQNVRGPSRMLCIAIDAPELFKVTFGCRPFLHPASEYTQTVTKHSPWNPYFGQAGDQGYTIVRVRKGVAR